MEIILNKNYLSPCDYLLVPESYPQVYDQEAELVPEESPISRRYYSSRKPTLDLGKQAVRYVKDRFCLDFEETALTDRVKSPYIKEQAELSVLEQAVVDRAYEVMPTWRKVCDLLALGDNFNLGNLDPSKAVKIIEKDTAKRVRLNAFFKRNT